MKVGTQAKKKRHETAEKGVLNADINKQWTFQEGTHMQKLHCGHLVMPDVQKAYPRRRLEQRMNKP